ncbi:hypothetical protein [Streptomyces iakyrus]|uniref:hypothetical protein n=1 Tax=Streptomyces iakyrus TaxID=68219 RepID=UPI00340E5FA0
MRVVQTRNHPAAERVDHFRIWTDVRGDVVVVTDHGDDAVANGDRLDLRTDRISGVNFGVANDQVCGVVGGAVSKPTDRHRGHLFVLLLTERETPMPSAPTSTHATISGRETICLRVHSVATCFLHRKPRPHPRNRFFQ